MNPFITVYCLSPGNVPQQWVPVLLSDGRVGSGPADAQRIGVVDAVAARQRGSHQRHDLVAGVGPARRIAQVQVLLYQLGKASDGVLDLGVAAVASPPVPGSLRPGL